MAQGLCFVLRQKLEDKQLGPWTVRAMKPMLSGWFAVLFVTCAASAEDLDGPNYYYRMALGGFSVADNTVDVAGRFESTNDVKPGIAFSGVFGRRLDDFVSVEADIGLYSSNRDGYQGRTLLVDCDGDDCFDPSINTLTFTVNGVVSGPINAGLRPYIGAGAGLMHSSVELDDTDSQTGFGYLVKVGVDTPIFTSYRAGLEYTYLGAPDVDFDNDLATFRVAGNAVMVTITGLF